MIREAVFSNNLSLTFTSEESLDLIENVTELKLRCIQERELPCVWLTPEEGLVREVLSSFAIHANGDIIVGFNSYSQCLSQLLVFEVGLVLPLMITYR